MRRLAGVTLIAGSSLFFIGATMPVASRYFRTNDPLLKLHAASRTASSGKRWGSKSVIAVPDERIPCQIPGLSRGSSPTVASVMVRCREGGMGEECLGGDKVGRCGAFRPLTSILGPDTVAATRHPTRPRGGG
jgi:hypothetical protein